MEEKPRSKAKIFFAALAMLTVGASFFVGLVVGYEHRPGVDKIVNVLHKESTPQFAETDMSLFWDVWAKVEEKYVDRQNLDRQKLIYGAIGGLVHATGDQYSEFFPPVENKQFQEDIKGAFEGIGAEIGMRQNVLTIVSPLKGSPAEKAGLKPGDKVFKIDDKITTDMQLDEAVSHIRGPKGTTVKLVIVRDGVTGTKEISVMRDTIQVPVIVTEKKSDGIFVIHLYHFTENSGLEFRKAVEEFTKSGAGKIVLDVRGNPGGYLVMAVDIASWFTQPGDVIVRERNGDGQEQVYRSSGYKLLADVPTVMLVDEGSASASEILAGALRDLKQTQLIGAKTFGKGSVQELVPLSGESSLKITIAKWLTPNGTEINGKGIEPDIKVELTKDKDGNVDPAKDAAMEKALEYLKGK